MMTQVTTPVTNFFTGMGAVVKNAVERDFAAYNAAQMAANPEAPANTARDDVDGRIQIAVYDADQDVARTGVLEVAPRGSAGCGVFMGGCIGACSGFWAGMAAGAVVGTVIGGVASSAELIAGPIVWKNGIDDDNEERGDKKILGGKIVTWIGVGGTAVGTLVGGIAGTIAGAILGTTCGVNCCE